MRPPGLSSVRLIALLFCRGQVRVSEFIVQHRGACTEVARCVLTRFRPSTMTLGILSSRMTLLTIPVSPLSLPAVITTLSPRSIFHLFL
jgi:hypothetical protein